MNYIISDKKGSFNVQCIKNGSYSILTVEYNESNKHDILKMVLDFVSKLEDKK